MPTRAILQENFDALLEAYRRDPGNHVAAAAASLLDPRTARKAWEKGLRRFLGHRAIRDLVAEEQEEARAMIIRAERAARDDAATTRRDAKKHAARAFQQEGLLVEDARGATADLLRSARAMFETSQSLGAIVRLRLQEMISEDEEHRANPQNACPLCERLPGKIEVDRATNLLAQLTRHLSASVEIAHKVMVMERLHLGRPGEIVGLQGAGAITLQEGVQRAAAAVAALESAARRGVDVKALPPLHRGPNPTDHGTS